MVTTCVHHSNKSEIILRMIIANRDKVIGLTIDETVQRHPQCQYRQMRYCFRLTNCHLPPLTQAPPGHQHPPKTDSVRRCSSSSSESQTQCWTSEKAFRTSRLLRLLPYRCRCLCEMKMCRQMKNYLHMSPAMN